MIRANLFLCFVLGLSSLSSAQSVAPATSSKGAADPAVIRLASGREFRGLVDPRTDETKLWLRCVYGGAVVLRPIRWDQIQSAIMGGESLDVQKFRDLAQEAKTLTPRQAWPVSLDPPELPRSSLGIPFPAELRVPLVRSLAASTQLSNWDADAIADGLTLVIQPLSCEGAIVPVEGTVETTLFGYDRRSGLPLERWSQLTSWTQPLSLACYGPEGGVLRFPLDPTLVELPRYGSPRRLLRVRLQAPGHGTFEAEIPFLARRRVP